MTVHDKRAVRDLHWAKKILGNRLLGGCVSRQWVAEAEQRVRARCRVLRAALDRAGRAREHKLFCFFPSLAALLRTRSIAAARHKKTDITVMLRELSEQILANVAQL